MAQLTIYSTVSTMQSARCLSILSSARSVLLHMVLYSIQSRAKVVAILCFESIPLGEAFQGGRSDCSCAYEICSDLLNRFRGFCGSNPCISVGFLDDHTSARFKSYQFLKVVSGGRAPGKSSSFASSQLLVIERFHCAPGKSSIFSIAPIFKAYICSFFQGGKRWLLLACCC